MSLRNTVDRLLQRDTGAQNQNATEILGTEWYRGIQGTEWCKGIQGDKMLESKCYRGYIGQNDTRKCREQNATA
jgi:hypothetical protein